MECYICPNLMKKQSHLHTHFYIEILPFSSAPQMLWWYQGRTSRTCQSCRREPDCWAGRAGGWWRKGDVWRVKEVLFNMKVKWHVAKYGDPLWIRALHLPIRVCTHTHTHTHTHTEQWAAIYSAAHGEQLGVRCLAQGHLAVVLKVERALDIHSPPPTIPAGPRLELTTFQLWIQLSNH